jgi:hypothetical protein
MRRPLIIFLWLLGAGIIIIQFFQPERNEGGGETESDLITWLSVPDSVAVILKASCYDCHSSHTAYPWYSRIAPVSWFLNKHITEGKNELNFSEFGLLEKKKKVGILSEICEVVESGTMPLKSYRLIHREAGLDGSESGRVCSWSESEAMKLLRSNNSQ